MPWYNVTLTPEENNGKSLTDILNDFSALSAQKLPPSDTGLFTQTENGADYSFSVYFSPACKEFCPELLEKYHAIESDKPSAANVEFAPGSRSASSLLN